MRGVILTQEGLESENGYFHFLRDEQTVSLCGVVNNESQFASQISKIISQQEAERRGLELCGRCASIKDWSKLD